MIDHRKDEGENEGGENIGHPVLVGQNATRTGEGNKGNHHDFEDGAGDFGFDVFRQNHCDKEEDGGDDHHMSRRERWFAGAVGTDIEDKDFVKNEVNGCHQS